MGKGKERVLKWFLIRRNETSVVKNKFESIFKDNCLAVCHCPGEDSASHKTQHWFCVAYATCFGLGETVVKSTIPGLSMVLLGETASCLSYTETAAVPQPMVETSNSVDFLSVEKRSSFSHLGFPPKV